MMKSLKREACRGQLMSLALFSLEKKRLSGILMQSSTFPVMEVEDQALVYALSTSNRTQANETSSKELQMEH